MSDVATGTGEKASKAPKVAKEKAPKIRKIAKRDPATKITFGADKEGKEYGKANNPKRGASADRFALYRKNMTLQQAVDAGLTSGDINWDLDKGYIKIAEAA